ncbi:MAG: small ribosomal subunit Rsm22 family protein [Methylococcales bacterium]|nr:small ribosomal subunit Rsm22 family protein [Methylococcales bacterium]
MGLLSSIRTEVINPHMDNIIRDLHKSIDYDKWNGCSNVTPDSESCVDCLCKQYFNGNKVDYSCEQKRKIYVIRYLPVHVHEIYIAIKKSQEDILEIIASKNEINILSIGGGLGSDILAMKSFIVEKVKQDMPKFNILRIDKENGWNDLSKEIVNPDFSGKINENFNNRQFLFDVALNELNLKNLKFDIVLISYLISEISDNDMCVFIKNIQSLFSDKAVLIINDRNEGLVQNRILKLLDNLSVKIEKHFIDDKGIWCGYLFPSEIKSLFKPKTYTNSKQHSVLIKNDY